MAEHVVYDEDINTVYHANNNARLIQEKREIIIQIEEGLKSDSAHPAKLGSFTISMADVDRHCPSDGTWGTLRGNVSESTLLESGEVEIQMRKIPAKEEFIRKKQEYTGEKLFLQVENIRHFNNEEQKGLNTCKLTANIKGPGNLSLLHAAIQLQLEDLVKILLDLGADPNAKSVAFGSALTHAQVMWDRVNEKMMTKQKSTGMIDPLRVEMHRRSEAIVQLLRTGERRGDDEQMAHEEVDEDQLSSPRSAPLAESSANSLGPDATDGTPRNQAVVPINRQVIDTSSSPVHDDPQSLTPARIDRMPARIDRMDDSQTKRPALCDSSTPSHGTLDDRTILTNIFRNAPASAGGTPNATASLKSYVGSKLRTLHSARFPNREAVRAFLERVVASGIATETEGKHGRILTLSLGEASSRRSTEWSGERRDVNEPSNPPKRGIATQRFVAATKNVAPSAPPSVSPYGPAASDGLPTLANYDWMLEGERRCKNSNSPGGCVAGILCPFVHVQPPFGGHILDGDDIFQGNSYPLEGVNFQAIKMKQVGGWYVTMSLF
jgi:hypothetical protein